MTSLRLCPPYKVTVTRNRYNGQLEYTPQFRRGGWVAWKIWHHRVQVACKHFLLQETDWPPSLDELYPDKKGSL